MSRFWYHPAAEDELVEAARYYEKRSDGLGHRFLSEVRDHIDEIVKHPDRFPVFRGDVRRKSLDRFPYNLLYVIEENGIKIVAVMHQKRRPNYWIGRLKD